MNRVLLACSLVSSLVVLCHAQTAEEGRAAFKQINDYRQQVFDEGRKSGKLVSQKEIKEKVDAKAEELLKAIDPAKIEPAAAYEWARVYETAERYSECCALARKFLETKPADKEKFQAMYLMARSCNELGEGDMLAMTLRDIPVPDVGATSVIANMTANVFIDTIYDKNGLDAAISTLDAVEKKIFIESPQDYAQRTLAAQKAKENGAAQTKTDEERLKALEAQGAQINDNLGFTFANSKAELYKKAGKTKEGADVLNAFIAKMAPGSPAMRNAKNALTRMTLEGNPAPAIVSERGYGTFESLASLKGKVVVIDFFAHWCGPCIASFPAMEQMYSDLHDKGLEVVGVTTYYGYYQKENREKRDMPKDTEFAKMKEFIDEHKMPWPTVYGERSNFEAYGISGIPTAIVIGRDGVVHEVHVGYSPESFAEFRKSVEKLVAAG